MLTYAREAGYIERNPAHGIRKPADKRRSFRLASEGYRALGESLEAAERRGEHWQAIAAIRLLALTGCRRSEILNLKWSEVDFKGSCLRLGDTKTGASLRPLPEPAHAILAHLKRDGDYVFPGLSRARQILCFGVPQGVAADCWHRLLPAWPPSCLRQRGSRAGPRRIDDQGASRPRTPWRDQRLHPSRQTVSCSPLQRRLRVTSTAR